MSTPLDIKRFEKVRALHGSTEHQGERASAMRAMRAIAKAAGLSVAQAIAELERPKAVGGMPEAHIARCCPGDDFFDWLFGGP